MLRLGYVYDASVDNWFVRDGDCLFVPITKDAVKSQIMRFLHKRAPSGINIPLRNCDSILERLRSCSYEISCFDKFDSFLIQHDEYNIPYQFDGWEFMPNSLIPVRNGVINPATMELLPHCSYLLHHTVYDFYYRKLSVDEVLSSPERDIYKMIIPDDDTLDLFLWWVGMVLFSRELPRMFVFLYGTGGTGKTTLSLGLSKILTPNKCLQLNYSMYKQSRFMTGGFVDKQLVVIDEMDEGTRDTSLIKQLTGGTSNFVIEEKYKQPRNVALMSKILLIGNSYPSYQQDTAFLERCFIIGCSEKQDSSIRQLVLTDESLNWLFNAGYYYYVVKHPQTNVKTLSELRTAKMLVDLDNYRDSDPFVYWIKERLGTDEITIEGVQSYLERRCGTDVYKDYQMTVNEMGGKALGVQKFNTKLRQEYGLEYKTLRGIDKIYKGYKIIPKRQK